MTQNRIWIENGYYHLYNRGNHKENIFQKDADYRFYLQKLKKYKKKSHVNIFAYCLMPNHIHILCQSADPKNISKMMHCLQLSYTAYFNEHYEKVGHLWQGRFKSKLITNEKYFSDCIIS